MRKIWNYISNLGITSENRQLSERTIVLTNQLNFVMFITMFFLLVYTVAVLLKSNDNLSYGTLRVVILLLVTFLNLVIARFGFTQLSRLSLVFLPTVVFLLGPTLIGYVEEESFYYYPYLVISASIIPQLLVNPREEKFLFWFSIAYYFFLVTTIDNIMVLFGKGDYKIVESINSFYAFYKISNVTVFLFINACIYYLRRLNFQYEGEMRRKNNELARQNIELKKQKNEIERQKDELVSKEISTWQKLVNNT
jgi:hypothetical protein